MQPIFSIRRQGGDVVSAVNHVFEGVGLHTLSGESVFLKPNFTYPFFKQGVTTTREVIEAVVKSLKDRGARRVVIGEGDGGYNSFSMDETFANYRLNEFTERYGVEVVNTSRWPSLTLDVSARRGRFAVNVPKPLFEEFGAFITLPVPKVHAMTTVSGAVKNQWGLVQDRMRLHFHVAFDEIINEVCRRLPRSYALLDGTFGLTRNGPMIEGIPLELGWVAGANNLWLCDRLMCELMRMPMAQVEHLMWAEREGLMPRREDAVIPPDFGEFIDARFYLKRNFWNYLAKSTWYSRSWNHFVYFGRLSAALHKVMYSIRHKPRELSAKGVDWK